MNKKSPVKVDTRALRGTLAEYGFRAALMRREKPLSVMGTSLVSDGRVRARVTRELTEYGYLAPIEGESACYTVTSKAYDEVSSVEVEEAAEEIRKRWDSSPRYCGVVFESLPIAVRKTALAHPECFRLWSVDSEGSRQDRTPISEINSKEISDIFFGYAWRKSLVVSTVEIEEAFDRAHFEKRLDSVRAANVAWGLEKLGLFNKEDAETIKVDDSPFPGIPGSLGLSSVVAEWDTEVPALCDRLEAKISTLQKRLALLRELSLNISSYGGTAKLAADYDAALVEALREHDRKAAAEQAEQADKAAE